MGSFSRLSENVLQVGVQNSSQHEHLLSACLSESSSDFEESVRSWERIQVIDDIDYASMRLIPYLYKQSLKFKIDLRDKGICKGLYLKSWYTSQVRSAMPQQELSEQGLLQGSVILKGAALQQTIYLTDPPTRPADDIDLLVSPVNKRSQLSTLIEVGFKLDGPFSADTVLNLRNSANLIRGASNVDVHWSIFPICYDPDFNQRLVARATMGNHGFLIPSATDNLIHALVHGYGSNIIQPIRWVLDAVLLIRSGEIDWPLFKKEVEATGWGPIVSHQLEYLRQAFDISLPEGLSFRAPNGYLIWLSSMYLRTDALWLRRILRLLGWDFAVLAANVGVVPTFVNYFRIFPLLAKSFLQEFAEFLRKR